MPTFDAPLDASAKIGTVPLTTSEDELILNNPAGEKILIWCQADQDWFVDTVSGEPDASRLRVVAKMIFPLVLDPMSASKFYIKGTASATLVLWQPE